MSPGAGLLSIYPLSNRILSEEESMSGLSFTGQRIRTATAFSLVELVIVVTIIGVVAAVAVPRMSHAARSASAAALLADLTSVRKAIDCYYAEHGSYPGYVPSTTTPDGEMFVKQLTMFSDRNGATSDTYTAGNFMFGPYLRTPFPRNPTNNLDTVHVKAEPSGAAPADGSVGWVAVLSHGYFGISATDTDLDDIGIEGVVDKGKVRVFEP
jgi:prepilin-type N-terminal cleavage/methylation domain-containing protein